MKLHLESLPASLADQRETIARCLEKMNEAMPLQQVYLFGSHARGEARPDSDVDLCLVARDAATQTAAISRFGVAIWDVWPRPSMTLIPITPARLQEKRVAGDYFFQTVFNEGVLLATEN